MPKIIEIRQCLFKLQLKMWGVFMRHSVGQVVGILEPENLKVGQGVLSCLARVGGVNTTDDKIRQFCLVSTQFH